jgi:hypothetical protein
MLSLCSDNEIKKREKVAIDTLKRHGSQNLEKWKPE